MKWLGRLLSMALVTTLLVAGLSTAPAQAGHTDGGYYPRQGGLFNVPRGTIDNQERILDHFLTAINHTKKGALIQFSLFSFDRHDIARALIRAKKRGVKVQILLNNHQVTKAQRMLRKVLGRKRSRNNFVYECTNGCRSTGENLHSKFFLFSRTGKAENVVMTGSVNFTTNGSRNQYNDLWTKNETPKLYAEFQRLFEEMKKDKPQQPGWWYTEIGDYFKLGATPYGHPTAQNDPIMDYLKKVKCFGAKNGNKYGRTMIRVVMHAWNGERGQYLARKIRNLWADGCDVKLLFGFGGTLMREALKRNTPRGRVPLRSTGYDTDFDGFLDLYTHQKELLIRGHFGKDRSADIVVTGSSNWTREGLRGDEEIFSVDKPGAMRQYMKQFSWLWTSRSYVPGWAGGPGQGLVPPEDTTEEEVVTLRTATLGVPALLPALAAARSMQGGKPGGPAWEVG